MKTKHGAVFLAACLLVPLAAQGQSYSLPDGGSVEVDIGADGGGSVSVTAPSVGIDFSVSFGGAGGSDPGSISAGGGGSGGVTSTSRARALAIPGLSEGPTAGKSGSSEQTSRSLASRSGGSGRAAQGLGGEWVSAVTGPGYNVPGFQAGPVGSYGVDAPLGPTISSTGSYTVSDPDSPTPPDDASYAINAPTASPDAQGAGAAPGGFNPITADQGTPIGGVGAAGIGPPAASAAPATGRATPASAAAPLVGSNSNAIPAPAGPSLLGTGITTGPADKAPPATPVAPPPTTTIIVIDERDDIFDEIADLLGVSRDVIFETYEENAGRLADLVAAGDRDGLVDVLTELANDILTGPQGPVAATTPAATGGFRNLATE